MLVRNRDALVAETNARRSRAKQTHDRLLGGEISAQDIPAAIRQTDNDYLTITVLITKWHGQFALGEFNCEEQIRKATRAFNSFYDPNYKKPFDELKAMASIENSVAGGVLCNFRPYLHDKIKYMKRVKMYLEKLNLQLNGHTTHNLLSFQNVHTSDSTLAAELRSLTANVHSLSETTLLNVFEAVTTKITAANLDELPKPVKRFFVLQQQTLETFNFHHTELNHRNAI